VTRPSGILLAGGASRRFGRPKLVEPLDGAPLFHRALRALVEACEDVVVVLAPGAPDLPLPDDALRVRFVRDEAAFEGPLAGCRAGLEHARGEYAALLGADMPGVTGALISLMASRAGEARAIVLSDGDAPRPLPAVVHVASALALARSLIERDERRLRALVDGLGAESLAEAVWRAVDPAGAWRQDVDAPGDLAPRRT